MTLGKIYCLSPFNMLRIDNKTIRMTLEDTLETYSYFIKEADAMGLAYICLLRYAAKLDASFDGKCFFII